MAKPILSAVMSKPRTVPMDRRQSRMLAILEGGTRIPLSFLALIVVRLETGMGWVCRNE